MASSSKGKRPLENAAEDSDAKRIRSNDGSPAPANAMSEADRKKQENKARMEAIKAKLAAKKVVPNAASGPFQTPSTPVFAGTSSVRDSDVESKRADAMKKIAEMKAKLAANKRGQSGASPPPPVVTEKKMSDRDIRIAEARARARKLAEELEQRGARKATQASSTQGQPPEERNGLQIGLHPTLMRERDGSKRANGSFLGSGNDQTKGNRYLVAPDSKFAEEMYDSSLITKKGGERKPKRLEFFAKGRFMAQANALRHQARMEEMKAQMAADIRKTEIEEASDKAFLIAAPPDVEWWDEGVIDKIDTPDSIVTALVQHPIILDPPQDKFQPAPKPLKLTPKEQAKIRRNDRREKLKEEQAKIRLGLIDPPPPKVKKSNMMTVYGEQAVQDPTAVEARVNREIAQRESDHVRANAERALTDEQRKEKLKRQQAGDEAKGIHIAVFKVDNLSNGKHRYQVDVNAKEHGLTGIVVLHPEMNLIIVEGGTHSMTKYKKVLLNRVKWTENVEPPAHSTRPSTFVGANDGTKVTGEYSKASQWLNPVDDEGELKDLSQNRCQLVWEGQEAQRVFRRWGSKACETDGEARDILSRNKMENMWTRARSMP